MIMDAKAIKAVLDELRSSLELSVASIDRDVSRQPQLYLRAAEAHAAAVSLSDAAKDELKVREAAVYLKQRKAAIENDEKFTETVITSRVTKSSSVVALREQLRQTQELVNAAAALKDAYSQRSYMLNHMADLIVSGFFSDPSIRKNTGEASHEVARTRLAAARKANAG